MSIGSMATKSTMPLAAVLALLAIASVGAFARSWHADPPGQACERHGRPAASASFGASPRTVPVGRGHASPRIVPVRPGQASPRVVPVGPGHASPRIVPARPGDASPHAFPPPCRDDFPPSPGGGVSDDRVPGDGPRGDRGRSDGVRSDGGRSEGVRSDGFRSDGVPSGQRPTLTPSPPRPAGTPR